MSLTAYSLNPYFVTIDLFILSLIGRKVNVVHVSPFADYYNLIEGFLGYIFQEKTIATICDQEIKFSLKLKQI